MGVRRVRPDENSLPRFVDASILMVSMLSWVLGLVGVRRVHPDENSFPFALTLKEMGHQESILEELLPYVGTAKKIVSSRSRSVDAFLRLVGVRRVRPDENLLPFFALTLKDCSLSFLLVSALSLRERVNTSGLSRRKLTVFGGDGNF